MLSKYKPDTIQEMVEMKEDGLTLGNISTYLGIPIYIVRYYTCPLYKEYLRTYKKKYRYKYTKKEEVKKCKNCENLTPIFRKLCNECFILLRNNFGTRKVTL